VHERLLAPLLAIADVRLVAALRDERLGFPATKDLRIFLPDVHPISDTRREEGGYVYTTNHPDPLTELAVALTRLRTRAPAGAWQKELPQVHPGQGGHPRRRAAGGGGGQRARALEHSAGGRRP
jgi:hypothetical protein